MIFVPNKAQPLLLSFFAPGLGFPYLALLFVDLIVFALILRLRNYRYTDLKNELQSTIKAQNVQIDNLSIELKKRNERLLKRDQQLQKLDDSIQLLKVTIARQDEAMQLLSAELKKKNNGSAK